MTSKNSFGPSVLSEQVAVLPFLPLAPGIVNMFAHFFAFGRSASLLQTTDSETLAPGIPPANTAPADLLGLIEAVLGASQKTGAVSRGRSYRANLAKFCQ